ncbi:MAG: PD40 domain-containing protein [Deltaproteobacteria bacterium]|nr:PD40 domain-containing protein [Deltaproteobacteria bacterium]
MSAEFNTFQLFIIIPLFLLQLLGCDNDKNTEPVGAVSIENSMVEKTPAFYDSITEKFHSTVTVTINDPSENPIEGVTVSLTPDGTLVSVLESTVSTDSQGKAVFEIYGNHTGEHTLAVVATPFEGDSVNLEDVQITHEIIILVEPAGEPEYVWDSGSFPFKMILYDSTGVIVSGNITSDNDAVFPVSLTTDGSGQALFTVETEERGEMDIVFSLAGIIGELVANITLLEFGHGSIRPACQYEPGSGRIPYFEAPVVVSPDWSEPVKVSSPVTDACPNDAISLSNDGKTLYFFWSPVVEGNNEQLLHIHTGTYWADLTGEGPGNFTTPRFYDLNGGNGGSVDGALSFTPDGSEVIFHSTRNENLGFQENPIVNDFLDMYIAPVNDGVPGLPVNPGVSLNSIYIDGEHGLDSTGSILYFSSDRPGGEGGIDIWFSLRNGQTWENPINPGPPLNTAQWEGQPNFGVSEPDKMYFVSNRDGPNGIYQSVYENGAWSEPELLFTGYVGEPTISPDGNTMYFVHVLVDEEGVYGSNIWYSVRN